MTPRSRAGTPAVRRTLLAVAVVLALSADDRNAGKVSDGRQVIETAVAIVETGSLGIAKGAPRAVEREDEAVSRYGLGASLAQLPAAFLAPFVEERLGAGSSQPLFLLASFAATLLAAGAAGAVARLAGAPAEAQSLAVLLAALGSPLGAYATSDFSEALQAAALAGALAFALASARSGEPLAAARRAAAAGLSAGVALLVKSSLAAAAPLLLLPLLGASVHRRRRLGAAALGAALPVAAWVAFELVRFGRPFGGYPGEGFTHPLFDGLWRLLVGPNRGLLLFFPAAALAVVGLARTLRRRDDPEARLAAAGSLAASLVLLVTSAAWWAWHGVGGWGPRLLVPAVPLLAPWASLVVSRLGSTPRRLVVAVSVVSNLPPLLVHPAFVDTYVANCRRPPLTRALSREVPDLAVETDDAGRPTVPPEQILSRLPAAAPHLLYPWFFAASTAGSPEEVAARLARPPWYDARPDLGPRLVPFPVELVPLLAPGPRWSFFGRAFFAGASDPAAATAYLDALARQVLRAHETARLERALTLAVKLSALRPGETSDALVLESLRLLGRREEALTVLSNLSQERAASPPVFVVRALFARDDGRTGLASEFAAASAPFFPDTPIALASGDPRAWPPTFAAAVRPGLPAAPPRDRTSGAAPR